MWPPPNRRMKVKLPEDLTWPIFLPLCLLSTISRSSSSAAATLLAGPLKSLRPGLVAEPVADEVGITSVDEDWDLLQDSRDERVERLHPVTLEEEVAVDVEVARVIAVNFGSNSFKTSAWLRYSLTYPKLR